MMFRRTGKSQVRGFTMIEMVITIVILGIVMVLGTMVLGKAFQSYDATQKTTDADWQGRVGMERMARELRRIGVDSSGAQLVTLPAASTSPLFFTDLDGSAVCFCYESATSTLRRGTSGTPNCGTGGFSGATPNCGQTATQPLADNVTSGGLNFYLYQSDGTAATAASNVYYFTVTLQVRETLGGGASTSINEAYRVTVQPRAFF